MNHPGLAGLRRKVFIGALAAACVFCGGAKGAEPVTVADFRDFARVDQADGAPQSWTTWSPRDEIAPSFSVDPAVGRAGRGALRIEGSNPAAFGAWRRRVENIAGGRAYRFVAHYRVQGVAQERRCVSARLEWLDENGKRTRPPDYALDAGRDARGRRWSTSLARPRTPAAS